MTTLTIGDSFMRKILRGSAIALGLLACGGSTVASRFVGTWSCVNDVHGGLPTSWTMDLVENADGTLSPPETDPGDVDASIGVCNAKNIIFVVSGSVAQSQAITCVTTLYEGETDTTQTTLTLDGGQLTYDENGTETGKLVGERMFFPLAGRPATRSPAAS